MILMKTQLGQLLALTDDLGFVSKDDCLVNLNAGINLESVSISV